MRNKTINRTFLCSFLSIVFAAFLACHGSYLGAAASPIQVKNDLKLGLYTQNLEELEDLNGEFDFLTIEANRESLDFHPVTRDSLNHLRGVQWFRGVLSNPSNENVTVYLQFDIVAHVKIGLLKADTVEYHEAGWKTPFRSREVAFLNPTLAVVVPPGETRFLIKNEGNIFNLTVGSKSAISEPSYRFEALFTFCLATFLALGIYSFFIYTKTLDRAYLSYALRGLVISALGLVMYNYLPKYFMPDLVFRRDAIVIGLMSLSSASWLFVTRRFLALDQNMSRKVISITINAQVLGLVLASFFPWVFPNAEPDTIFRIVAPLSFVWMFAIGGIMCWRRYRPAYFYMLSAGIYFGGVLTIILATEGVITATPLTSLAPQFCGAIEAILMSFGLGDKYMMAMKLANTVLKDRNIDLDRKLSLMLRSLDQGIFSFGPGGKINSEHSEYLKTILGKDQVAGDDVFEVLFKESNIKPDVVDQARNAALASLGEEMITFELNADRFPREITRRSESGNKTLEVDWQPLLDGEERCESMMVVLRDVTSLKTLIFEKESSDRNLKIVGQVLAISLPTFEKFSKNTAELIQMNLDAVDRFQESLVLDLASMYRHIHTIKGNARTFGLLYIADIAHEVEHYFSDLRSGKVLSPDPARFRTDLEKLRSITEEYNVAITKIKNIFPTKSDEDLVATLNDLHLQLRNAAEVKDKFYDLAERQRVQRYFPTLEEMLGPILRDQGKIAEELAKPAPTIKFVGKDIRLSLEMENILRNIFTQILRNSLDHGIEAPEQRMREGKGDFGTITVSIEASIFQNDFVIEVHDDGAGLNLAALAAKIDRKGLSDVELANTIFQTGVSTAEKITQISGRGVGMDIIKDLIIKNGGSIAIVFTDKKQPNGRQPFKLVLTFPSDCVLMTRANYAA